MKLEWAEVHAGSAGRFEGRQVEIAGWMIPPDAAARAVDGFLLVAEAPCCGPGLPQDAQACMEIRAALPVAVTGRAIVLRGWLRSGGDDPEAWRYRLDGAVLIDAAPAMPGRRVFLAAGAALGLAACARGPFASDADAAAPGEAAAPAWQPAPGALTIDMHSHGGRVTVSRDPALGDRRPFLPLAAPMRAGGMQVICLAIVTDTTVTRVSASRRSFEPWRKPEPGELHALGQAEFARARALIAHEKLQVVTDAASLARLAPAGPSVILAAEGADFLEGRIERVDEAYTEQQLRHLQLTHYRVNELGDIQSEAPVHGGLSDFGAAVVRRCNALGLVVDVAHGTYDLVKRAAVVSSKPLVLSHTALAAHPGARSRLVSPDHARVIAGTGGVIGVWPSAGSFRDLAGMADGIKRMVDVVGVDHVGLGSDMLGFISPPVFRSYAQLPALAQALLAGGFRPAELDKLLGGNYRRVFEASVG